MVFFVPCLFFKAVLLQGHVILGMFVSVEKKASSWLKAAQFLVQVETTVFILTYILHRCFLILQCTLFDQILLLNTTQQVQLISSTYELLSVISVLYLQEKCNFSTLKLCQHSHKKGINCYTATYPALTTAKEDHLQQESPTFFFFF